MLGYVAIVHIYFGNFFIVFIQGKERPAKTKLFLAKLRTVLITFGSSENLIRRLRAVLACVESDSTQC